MRTLCNECGINYRRVKESKGEIDLEFLSQKTKPFRGSITKAVKFLRDSVSDFPENEAAFYCSTRRSRGSDKRMKIESLLC